MVSVFERVFEIGPVFRAEHHDTSRHLNEYISMDFEMGFIDSFTDIMNMETGALKYIMELLRTEYAKEVALLGAKIPVIDEIPCIKFMDAKKIITEKYRKNITDFNDFEPEEEQLMCQYAEKEFGSEFIFVTHYPSAKRPFYAMDDPADPAVVRPAVPRNGGHDGRPAHSRLRRTGREDARARHESGRFRELSDAA